MNFKKGISPYQEALIPKKAINFLPENHLAKVIYEVVEFLDLKPIIAKYSESGQYAYNPKMMIRLLFYHYSIGIYSSRKIAKSCIERLDTMYLADGLRPSHDRISDFRLDNLSELNDLFSEIVMLGNELGLIEIHDMNLSVDGTKLKANASSKLSKTQEDFEKLLEKTNDEMGQLLAKAQQIDNEEDAIEKNHKIPEKLQSKKARKKAIENAIKKLKLKKDLAKSKIEIEKKRNVTKAESNKINKLKLNSTDNDAKFMKQRNGLIKPSYNGQIMVDEKEQFIVSNDVTDNCNDQHELIHMIDKTIKELGYMPSSIKGDNGYFPELDSAVKLYPEIDFYIDDRNRRKEIINLEEIKKTYSEEKLINLLKLLSESGENEYKKRMFTVEPVFGNLKENTGIRTFLLRKLKKVKGEFNLMCIGHNMKKISMYMNKKGVPIAKAILKCKENKEIMVKIGNSGSNLLHSADNSICLYCC
ncbi:MAG: transposase [Candidatus Woesearchaeota archaeon]